MRWGIVEGEPGIFPAPVAKVLARFNQWLRRDKGRRTEDEPEAREQPPPADA